MHCDSIQVNEEHVGLVMEALSHRRAEITEMGPVPGNIGRTRLCLTCPSRLEDFMINHFGFTLPLEFGIVLLATECLN